MLCKIKAVKTQHNDEEKRAVVFLSDSNLKISLLTLTPPYPCM